MIDWIVGWHSASTQTEKTAWKLPTSGDSLWGGLGGRLSSRLSTPALPAHCPLQGPREGCGVRRCSLRSRPSGPGKGHGPGACRGPSPARPSLATRGQPSASCPPGAKAARVTVSAPLLSPQPARGSPLKRVTAKDLRWPTRAPSADPTGVIAKSQVIGKKIVPRLSTQEPSVSASNQPFQHPPNPQHGAPRNHRGSSQASS